MRGDRLGNIESREGGAWYVNRKETHWGQGDIVVERRSEGCDKSQERGQEEVGNIRKAGRERDIYREANKKGNTEVARSNAQAMDEVYSKSCKH